MKFRMYEVYIKTGIYENNRMAIRLHHERFNFELYEATLNMPNVDIEPDEAIIKDFSECEGMPQFLESIGVIKSKSGYAINYPRSCAPICKINLERLKELDPDFEKYIKLHYSSSS